jgi:ATPase subunit of ABC transporter with duplicated ATPase domains
MLTLSGLQKSFGGRVLFDDVALSLLKGERVGLSGQTARASPRC